MIAFRFRSSWALAAVAASTFTAGCKGSGSDGTAAAANPPARTASAGSASEVVAEVNGEPITRAQLEEKAGGRLTQVRQQEYDVLKGALDQVIAERLLESEAKQRGLSRPDLEKAEIADKAGKPSAAEVESVYQQYAPRLQGRPREQVLPDIENALRQRKGAERAQAFHSELRGKAKLVVHLQPPRQQVPVPADALGFGAPNAPVTIVEFADYQCPYCRRAQGVIDEVLKRYEGKVRLVHRDFPLDGHPRALPAARAARCANEQGKFWEMHRSLLTVAGELTDEDLKQRASSFGLDTGAFMGCVASGKYDAVIQQGVQDGQRLGVSGTPFFFINGRMVNGALPLEQFTEIIDSELASRS